jgi:hypothetical protein
MRAAMMDRGEGNIGNIHLHDILANVDKVPPESRRTSYAAL